MALRADQYFRSLIPPTIRAKLLRSGAARNVLKFLYGGIKSKPYPQSPHTFYFEGSRGFGWSTMDLSRHESTEIAFVRKLFEIDPPDCIWDVGANIGFWTLFFSSAVPSVPVVAFEPDATNLKLLRMNVERNRLVNVAIRQCALSDAAGEATFFSDDLTGATGSLQQENHFIVEAYGMKTRAVVVEVSTIDAEVSRTGKAPGFIKMDVEGHELTALRGAAATMRDHRPNLIVEVAEQNQGEAGELFRSHRYRLFNPESRQPMDQPAWNTVAVPEERVASLTQIIGQHPSNA